LNKAAGFPPDETTKKTLIYSLRRHCEQSVAIQCLDLIKPLVKQPNSDYDDKTVISSLVNSG
jgi:hypothetical protein